MAASILRIEYDLHFSVTAGLDVIVLLPNSYRFFFKSRLVSKKSKLKLYWSIIRPIVTYGCETWVLKETIKNKLTLR